MPIRLLHNIGESPSNQAHIKANYNTREEILACADQLTLDGIYENVWRNRDIIQGRNAILFVMGDYIGKDNSFDTGMPHETYCTEEQLQDLVDDGHILAWHTWSHPDLTTLSYEEAKKEMTPKWPCKYFAFPYGRFNQMTMDIAKELGYEKAYSVTQGNDNPYSLYRAYL